MKDVLLMHVTFDAIFPNQPIEKMPLISIRYLTILKIKLSTVKFYAKKKVHDISFVKPIRYIYIYEKMCNPSVRNN